MAKALGYGYDGDMAAASALPSQPTGGRAYRCLIQTEAQSIRWRDDGVDPTAAVGGGFLLPVNVVLEYEGPISAWRGIETAAGAKLNVAYYGI